MRNVINQNPIARNVINTVSRHQAVWILVGCLLLGSIGGLLVAKLSSATYTATTQLFIGSPAAGDSAGLYQGDLFSQQRAATYAQLFGGDDLATKVIDDLSLDMTPSELTEKVSASAVDKTVLLDVTVTDDSAQGSADIANAYAANFARYVGQLENPEGGSTPSTQVSVIRRAEAPEAPSSPSTGLNVVGGAVLGLVVGGVVVWLRRRFDTSVHDVDTAADLVDAAGLGLLPADPDREMSLLRLPQQASTPYAEAMRKLRTTIQFTDPQRPLRRMVVVGVDEGDGAHSVAAHLALMFGEVGRRVVLVDGDMRTAPLNVYLPPVDGQEPDDDATKGLSDVLHGAANLDEVLVPLADGRFDLLPAGSPTPGPAEDVASPAMSRLIGELHNRYAYVILLGAAAAEYTDAAVLAVNTDGVILVARAGSTDDANLTEAGVAVRSAGARLLGVLLTSGLRAKVAKEPRTATRTPLPAIQNARPHRSTPQLGRRPEDNRRDDPNLRADGSRREETNRRAGLENLHRVRQEYSAPDGRDGSTRHQNGSAPARGDDGWWVGPGAQRDSGQRTSGSSANGQSAAAASATSSSPVSDPPSREIARLDPMRWSPDDTSSAPPSPQPVDSSAMTEPISIQKRPAAKETESAGGRSESAKRSDTSADTEGDQAMRWVRSAGSARATASRPANGHAYPDNEVIDAEVVDVEDDGPSGWRSTYNPSRSSVGAHRAPSGEMPVVPDRGAGDGAKSAGYPGVDSTGYVGRPSADDDSKGSGDDDTVAISSRRTGS